MLRRRFLVTALALTIFTFTLASQVSALPADSSLGVGTEELASRASRIVADRGALSVYWDQGTEELAVVFPSTGVTMSELELGSLGVRTRVEVALVTAGDIAWAKGELASLADSGLLGDGVWGVGLDVRTGRLVLEASGEPSLVSEITDRFGDELRLENAPRSFDLLGRLNDLSPFWGGARIKITDTNFCSSGFSVKKPSDGTKFLTTAGHCWPVGTVVKTWHGLTVGTITFRFSGSPSYGDVAFLSGQAYGGAIYLGGATGSQGNVVSAGDPVVGFTYCSGGSVSYELCDQVATQVNFFRCFTPPFSATLCIDSLAEFSGTTWQPGDSGGPVYAKTGSNVRARASISARSGGVNYAYIWSAISSDLGVTICTVAVC